jgi:hypothetical protein
LLEVELAAGAGELAWAVGVEPELGAGAVAVGIHPELTWADIQVGRRRLARTTGSSLERIVEVLDDGIP